ncbi:hypothetical protein WBG99_25400 [Streptomyces sp. TG1A-60]|uniref:hypothetical protein n=1 Tax=Streptomyces sp. TG1A-60 TaxID=3129111 RepID=UPI0030CF3D32
MGGPDTVEGPEVAGDAKGVRAVAVAPGPDEAPNPFAPASPPRCSNGRTSMAPGPAALAVVVIGVRTAMGMGVVGVWSNPGVPDPGVLAPGRARPC